MDDEAVVCEVLLETLEHGHFLAAGRAPRGPKIQDYNLATIIGEGAGRFVGNELELELRRDFVGIPEDRLQRVYFGACPSQKSDRFIGHKDSN
jgi:hypothetical protein